jgi:hypothetical protein
MIRGSRTGRGSPQPQLPPRPERGTSPPRHAAFFGPPGERPHRRDSRVEGGTVVIAGFRSSETARGGA